jgi:hypothetical protein
MANEKGQKNKQRSSKHTHKTKDRVILVRNIPIRDEGTQWRMKKDKRTKGQKTIFKTYTLNKRSSNTCKRYSFKR